MDEFERKRNTHLVLKLEDMVSYLTVEEMSTLNHYGEKISRMRRYLEGKSDNSYYVINKDEPYADEILEVIKRGEIEKANNRVEYYRGFKPRIQWSPEDACYNGKIENTTDLVCFEGKTKEIAIKNFEDAVDVYIEFCDSFEDPDEKI
jgi:predicted RNase H-like HicB family nuclease